MSVKIRLAKIGKKNAPIYRLVVSQTKTKRNGRFLDILGTYDPTKSVKNFEFDKQKYDEWVSKGALPTESAKELVEGTYKYVKYNPRAEKEEKKEESAEPSSESTEEQEESTEVASE